MFFVTKILSETFNLKQEVFCLASWSDGGTRYRHTCVWNLGKDDLTAALYPGVLTFILYEMQERADLISLMDDVFACFPHVLTVNPACECYI